MALNGDVKRNPVVGVWASVSRQGANLERSLSEQAPTFRQVSRHGIPHVAFALFGSTIGLAKPGGPEDRLQARAPKDDHLQTDFLAAALDPVPPHRIERAQGRKAPTAPRHDIQALFLKGIGKDNGATFGFDLNTHTMNADADPKRIVPAEELRLNLSTPAPGRPESTGVLDGDLQGFPERAPTRRQHRRSADPDAGGRARRTLRHGTAAETGRQPGTRRRPDRLPLPQSPARGPVRHLITAAGAAVAVAGCVAGLLYLGPDTARPEATAPPAGAVAGTVGVGSGPWPRAMGRWVPSPPPGRQRSTPATRRPGPLWPVPRSNRPAPPSTRADSTPPTRHFAAPSSLDATDNYGAVTAQGLLANARHEFAQGRRYGLRATAMAPDRPDGYAVLADAEIQLGTLPTARTAVQRMLDIAPATAAYSRAAYDLETGGRPEDAAIALQRAVASAVTRTNGVSPRPVWATWPGPGASWTRRKVITGAPWPPYPDHPYGQAGIARVAAARGQTGRALGLYTRLVKRTPLPQFLLETLELRRATGAPAGGANGPPCRRRYGWSARTPVPVDPHLILYAADHGDPKVAVELGRREWKHARSVIVADALGLGATPRGAGHRGPHLRTPGEPQRDGRTPCSATTGALSSRHWHARGIPSSERGRRPEPTPCFLIRPDRDE